MTHLEQCRGFLRRREAERQAALEERFERAWNEARAIIALLISKYQPVRIYQWGSLLCRSHFWERSDIDVAVEGVLSPEAFFAMYGEADRMASVTLDLVALERIEPEFAEVIRTTGRLVYERDRKDSDLDQ
jgi:predicted nucleotidyltransferase